MRKSFLLVYIILNFLLIISSPAFSYYLNNTDVGNIDEIIASKDLGNSGYEAELSWAQETLKNLYGGDLTDYFFEKDSKIEENKISFELVDEQNTSDPDVYALDFSNYVSEEDPFPSFYFIKYGDGGIKELDSHQMYSNLDELQWAVISLNAVSTAGNFDIQRVSHMQSIIAGDSDIPTGSGPIPEPGTMFLFGFGLIGIAGFGRKRFKKG